MLCITLLDSSVQACVKCGKNICNSLTRSRWTWGIHFSAWLSITPQLLSFLRGFLRRSHVLHRIDVRQVDALMLVAFGAFATPVATGEERHVCALAVTNLRLWWWVLHCGTRNWTNSSGQGLELRHCLRCRLHLQQVQAV